MLKTSKQNRFKTAAMAAALAATALVPLSAHAAGLGRITVLSSLGQPLKAELEVTANRDELTSLAAKLAPAEAFRVAGIEYASALSTLRFSREVKERGGKRYVEITTDRPVNEPFIDMLVELSWGSGRLVREYTFLLDPPELAQKAPPPVVAPPEARPIESLPIQSAVQAPVVAPTELRTTPAIQTPPVRATAPAPIEARPKPLATETVPAAKKSAPLAAPAPAPAKTAAPATRETKSGDTLGKIANEVRPEGVSLDQMLVALFRSNPDAFNGNMNRMSSGKILKVPDADTVRSVDATEARREVLAQSSDFNAYRRKLADAAASGTTGTSAGGRSSSGKITAKVEDKVPPAATGKDKLEVSRTEAAPASKLDPKLAGKAPLEGRLSALEEDLASRERALRDASSRIAQLEKNLTDLKKLAELKSEAGATLQKQADAAKPAAPPPVVATVEKPAPVPAKVAPPAPPTPASEPPKTSLASVPPVASSAEAPKEVPAAPATPPAAPPPPKKKVFIPEPEPEPDFLEENGPLVFGGAGIIALLLGYLGFSAYRRKKQDAVAEVEAPVSEAAPSTNSVFSETTAESIDASMLASGDLSVSDSIPDTSGGAVDPLVEADTYLAFGRDAQAEEILLEALKTEPTRHAIHVKLLEIYSARRSTMQFNTLARDLRDQTGGRGSDWDRALAMGAALDPTNALYQAAEEVLPVEASVEDTVIVAAVDSAPESLDTEATMILAAPVMLEEPAPEPTAPATEEVASFDFDLDLGEPATAETESATELVAADTASADNVLDFDLDLGEPESEVAPATEPVAEPASDSAMALDIDFDLDAPTESPSAAEPVVEVVAIDVEPVPDSPTDEQTNALDIDFDIEAPALPAEPEAAEPAIELPAIQIADIETPATDNAIDFSLDLELPAAEDSSDAAVALPEIAAVETPQASADTSIDFDFDLGEADSATSAPSLPEAAAPVLDLGAINLELDTPADTPLQDLAAMDFDLDAATSDDAAPADSESQLELPVEEAIADNPEAATKLELAIAYEEMGDREGARELLEEVLKEGSPPQAAAAQTKLDSLV